MLCVSPLLLSPFKFDFCGIERLCCTTTTTSSPALYLHPESAAAGALLSVANDHCASNMRDLRPPRSNQRPRNARRWSSSQDNTVTALHAMNSVWDLQDSHELGRYGRNIRHLHNPPPPGQQKRQHQHPGHGF